MAFAVLAVLAVLADLAERMHLGVEVSTAEVETEMDLVRLLLDKGSDWDGCNEGSQ